MPATLSQFAQSLSVETAFTVLGVAKQLKAAGLRTFFAPDDLRPDIGRADWEKSIFDALRDSVHLAVYCSKEALTSRFVRDEITQFRNYVDEMSASDLPATRRTEPMLFVMRTFGAKLRRAQEYITTVDRDSAVPACQSSIGPPGVGVHHGASLRQREPF